MGWVFTDLNGLDFVVGSYACNILDLYIEGGVSEVTLLVTIDLDTNPEIEHVKALDGEVENIV